MSDLSISATEHGKLRVFSLSPDLSATLDHTGTLDALGVALGVEITSPDDVQIVPANTLGDLGLSGLVREGYDITPSFDDAARLDGLETDVALVRSAAFGGGAVTLTQSAKATLVATFTEGKAPAPQFTPRESDAAQGVLTPAAPPPTERSLGARLALMAVVAMFIAAAVIYAYYIGFSDG